MDTSTYNSYLLISTTPNAFALLVLQTDDSLFVASPEFANIKETELQKANLPAKPRQTLDNYKPMDFNGGRINLSRTPPNCYIYLKQKGQGDKLQVIDFNNPNHQEMYT